MKISRKISLIALAMLLFVTSVAANPYQVKQYLYLGQAATLSLGRMGVSYLGNYREGTASLTRWSKGPLYHSTELSFRRDMAYTRFTDTTGYNLRVVLGAVYVFFDLTNIEARNWNKGLVAIYYYHDATTTWKKCTTFKVAGFGYPMRVACRMTEYGLYALGTRR